MDGVHAIFETLFDWRAFSVRVREDRLHALPELLLSIPEERYRRMQRRVLRLMHRFA
jgi:hypothetical protein